MKTILIPTDFNLESTKIVAALVQDQSPEKLTIIFLHAFKLSDSITDMLMLSRRSRDYENVSDAFYQKMNACKAAYPDQIQCIGIEYFYGSTVAAFKNFLEAFEVDCIAYPETYNFNPINKYSIDPKYLVERSGCKVLQLDTAKIRSSENLMESKIPQTQLQTAQA